MEIDTRIVFFLTKGCTHKMEKRKVDNNRIAIFLGGYLPAKKYGGPVTSISNLVDNLGDKFEFYIISNDHDLDDFTRLPGIHDGWNQVGKARVLYLNEKDFSYTKFKEVLKSIEPTCVYLSSVFYYQMNMHAVRAAKNLGIKIIWATRGELSENAIKQGAWKKRPYLIGLRNIGFFDKITFQATSKEEYENIHRVIGTNNVVLLPNMPPLPNYKENVCKRINCVKVLTMSRIVSNKNTLYSIKLVNSVKSDIQFDIYGPIEDPQYWEQCDKEITKAPPNVKICYKGIIAPDAAKDVFLDYDCFLLPTKFENYGQAIAEALMHDCIPIISLGTTPWDDVNDYKAGFAVKIGEDKEYIDCIENIAGMDTEQYIRCIRNVRIYVSKKMDTEETRRRYLQLFTDVE